LAEIAEASQLLETFRSIPEAVSSEEIRKYCDLIMKTHEPIAGYFFTDFGINAQYLESKIIERVMRRCVTERESVPALLYHDSIITDENHVEQVEQWMREAYEAILGVSISADAISIKYHRQSEKRRSYYAVS
jgi:hypothetical protein